MIMNFTSHDGDAPVPCPPTNNGTYTPYESFDIFMGERMSGTWILEMMDGLTNEDQPTLTSWELEITERYNEDMGCYKVQMTVVVCPDLMPPVAECDESVVSGGNGTTVDFLANDNGPNNDLDSSSLTVEVAPEHGTAQVLGNGLITYVPDTGFVGRDSLTYKICDEIGLCTTSCLRVINAGSLAEEEIDLDIATDNGTFFLDWIYEGDKVIESFEVERLLDTDLEMIAMVDYNGYHTYTFVDIPRYPNEVIHYRIIAIDINGDKIWSNWKEVRMEQILDIFPNPASDVLNVMGDESARLIITDVSGRKVMETQNQSVIDLSSFIRGVYMERITIGNFTVTKRLIIE